MYGRQYPKLFSAATGQLAPSGERIDTLPLQFVGDDAEDVQDLQRMARAREITNASTTELLTLSHRPVRAGADAHKACKSIGVRC